MFKQTLAAIERLLHRESRTPSMEAIIPPVGQLDEARDYAELSKRYFREPIEFTVEGREILRGITTMDVDPATGFCYPDFLARRAKREADMTAGGEKQVYYLGNVRP